MADADITLCLIVRDEAEFLAGCLTGTAGICSDIVVVDTGSTDGTQDIARRFTDRVYAATLDGDFSAPRNVALRHAETEWVLFPDADEHFAPGELARIPGVLAAAADDVEAFRVLRYNFFATGGFFTNRVVKLIRNRPHVRYRRRVSESVRGSIVEAGGRVGDAPVVLNHVGHTRPVATRRAKSRRYADLMAASLAEKPEPGILGNRALLLLSLGRLDEALAAADEAVAQAPDTAALHYARGHALRGLDQGTAACAAYDEARRLDPADGVAHLMAGVMRLALGRLDEADAVLDAAAAADPLLQHVDLNRALVRQARGDHAGAAALLRDVARRNPGFLVDAWHGRAEVDLYSRLLNETVVGFAGLGYHLAYCDLRAAG